MKTAIINTPLGFTEICGDENGISKIHILNEETEISTKIPKELKEAVIQLDDYFKGINNYYKYNNNVVIPVIAFIDAPRLEEIDSYIEGTIKKRISKQNIFLSSDLKML